MPAPPAGRPSSEGPSAAGRPSRAAAQAALGAYVDVLKGEPLRRALQEALRSSPKLGGQERRFVAFAVRELSRHQALVDWAAKRLGLSPGSLLLKEDLALARYTLWRRLITKVPWSRICEEVKLPGPVRPRSIADAVLERLAIEAPGSLEEAATTLDLGLRYSFPGWLLSRLEGAAPPDERELLLAALNREAPLILRARPPGSVNGIRQGLLDEGVEADVAGLGTDALVLPGPEHKVFDTRAFRSQRLQVQDLGSQLIAQLCRAPGGWGGAHVADVCAGAGGKALYLADLVGPGGRVDAGDLSPRRLAEARSRARAWGLRQVGFPRPLRLEEADVVLVDAPCSGTGSLAREPDQKWALSPRAIAKWVEEQARILRETAAAVRPGGVLVYATCSLLAEENEEQVERFLLEHPGWGQVPAGEVLKEAGAAVQGTYLRVLPHRLPGGAFFAARLQRST